MDGTNGILKNPQFFWNIFVMIYRFLDVWCRSFETEPLVGEPQGGKWVIVQREGCVGERWRECQGKSRFPGVAVADGQPGSEHEPVYGESSCDIVPRVVNSVPRVWRQLPRMQIYRPHCTLIHRQFTLCGAFAWFEKARLWVCLLARHENITQLLQGRNDWTCVLLEF